MLCGVDRLDVALQPSADLTEHADEFVVRVALLEKRVAFVDEVHRRAHREGEERHTLERDVDVLVFVGLADMRMVEDDLDRVTEDQTPHHTRVLHSAREEYGERHALTDSATRRLLAIHSIHCFLSDSIDVRV